MATDNKSVSGESRIEPAEKTEQTSGDQKESQSLKDALGKENPASSGTTSLAGDSSTSNDKPGPGGVEGTGGTS